MVGEEAKRLHKSGYNCAQSVLAALREYTGLDDATALAVSGGFGGGLRCGEICGVVSGAVMALGMACPYNDCSDQVSKDKIAALAKEMTAVCKAQFNGLRCADIKGVTASCDEYIAFAAEAAEKIIQREKAQED